MDSSDWHRFITKMELQGPLCKLEGLVYVGSHASRPLALLIRGNRTFVLRWGAEQLKPPIIGAKQWLPAQRGKGVMGEGDERERLSSAVRRSLGRLLRESAPPGGLFGQGGARLEGPSKSVGPDSLMAWLRLATAAVLELEQTPDLQTTVSRFLSGEDSDKVQADTAGKLLAEVGQLPPRTQLRVFAKLRRDRTFLRWEDALDDACDEIYDLARKREPELAEFIETRALYAWRRDRDPAKLAAVIRALWESRNRKDHRRAEELWRGQSLGSHLAAERAIVPKLTPHALARAVPALRHANSLSRESREAAAPLFAQRKELWAGRWLITQLGAGGVHENHLKAWMKRAPSKTLKQWLAEAGWTHAELLVDTLPPELLASIPNNLPAHLGVKAAERIAAHGAPSDRALTTLLSSRNPSQRTAAIDALRVVGTPAAIPAMESLASSWFTSRRVARAQTAAMAEIRKRHAVGAISIAAGGEVSETNHRGGLSKK